MGWVTGIAVYLVMWWIVLFTILPWGVKADENPVEGYATGAPVNPGLKKKFIATTIVTAIVWLFIFTLIKMDVIDFYAISEQMMKEDGL